MKSEKIEVLSDPAKMVGMFAAKDVERTWHEDVIDEDTGEVVSVERYEMIIRRGTEITKEVAATLAFSIQSGELDQVACSHECRMGKLACYENCHQYTAKIKLNKKKLNVLLWAQKISQAFDVLVDWFELNYTGNFVIASIAETDNGVYLEGGAIQQTQTKVEEDKIYSIKIKMEVEEGQKDEAKILTVAPDVERAEMIINECLEKMNGVPILFKLEEVKVTSINVIIPKDFTLPYTDDYNETAQ